MIVNPTTASSSILVVHNKQFQSNFHFSNLSKILFLCQLSTHMEGYNSVGTFCSLSSCMMSARQALSTHELTTLHICAKRCKCVRWLIQIRSSDVHYILSLRTSSHLASLVFTTLVQNAASYSYKKSDLNTHCLRDQHSPIFGNIICARIIQSPYQLISVHLLDDYTSQLMMFFICNFMKIHPLQQSSIKNIAWSDDLRVLSWFSSLV